MNNLRFKLKEFAVDATANMVEVKFKNGTRGTESRHQRHVTVCVSYGPFTFGNDDLTELIYVKSTLQYFMSCYWKRSNKNGSNINLMKSIEREIKIYGMQKIVFEARQKANEHYLYVCIQNDGNTYLEAYFDGQEVIMLDAALGKAISWLNPKTSDTI
ncbi:MAG: hypothetical protein J0665_09710 [Deltaproteobacteria bacterium]|nr:hypothetical protein [Deltaproteobacteria bacterium]